VALVLAFAGSSRAQYVIGEEAGILGGEQGFFRPPVVAPSGPPAPTFDLVAGSTTPNDLPDSLVVNGTPMTLALACDADDISGTNWSCRTDSGPTTLAQAGTGGAPTVSTLTPWRAIDSTERQVAYAATGQRHDASTNAIGDLATDDLVFEIVSKNAGVSGRVLIEKGLAGTDGWSLNQTSASTRLQIRTASTTTSIIGAGAQGNAWSHSIIFVDRSEASTNGSIAYDNALAGTGVDVSARSGSMSNTSTLAVGAASGAASGAVNVSSFRIWRCAGCMAGGATNPTQWALIARERTARAWGLLPTASGTSTPTTLTRATQAMVDVVDGSTRQLYLVGNGAPRVARRTHGGTALVGYMSEPAVSNIALQSQTLGTTWTPITVGDNVLADQFAGADLTTTGDNIDGDNTAPAEHGLRQGIAVVANTYTYSAWARAGSQSFVALRNATIANGAAWFNLTTCTSGTCTIGEDCPSAVGTVQAGVTRASAERWPADTSGDGVADVNLCRVSITYAGTLATHNHDLLCAPSDNNLTYLDADTVADCGFWGVRLEAFPAPTSYLATTTAGVARNADDVRYDGASHYTGSPSTMDVGVLCPSFDTAATSTFASVGTGTANYARLGIDATNDRGLAEATVTTQQWNIIAGSGDVSGGVARTLRQTMVTDSIEAFVDGVSIGTDTLATLPTAASSFVYLGTTGSTAAASACLLSRVRLWSSAVTPAVVP
jgi:hypothetical protein